LEAKSATDEATASALLPTPAKFKGDHGVVGNDHGL
jgi:hypothetical protein